MKLNNFVYPIFYFLLLALFSLKLIPLPLDLGISNSFLHFNSTARDIIAHFGLGDPASFAKGGLAIFSDGWFSEKHETIWLINLWPPGFMLLEGVILKIFGMNAPLVGILQILAILILAIVCNLFRIYLCFYIKPMIAIWVPFILLTSSQFASFMLGADFVVFGETYAISFVLIGLFCILLSYKMDNKNFAIAAGIGFAASAYFRSQFEMFFMVATVNFLAIFISIKINNMKFIKSEIHSHYYRTALKSILISLITFHVMTVPYKIYTHHRIHSYLWVQTGANMLVNNFKTPEEVEGVEILKNAGSNVACLVDLANCAVIRKQFLEGKLSTTRLAESVLITFLKHPFHWISLKIQLLPRFWFDSQNQSLSSFKNNKDNFFNYIFIGCCLFSFGWVLFTIKSEQSLIKYWISSSICFSYSIIFMISHYESRYFYFFKFYFFVLSLICFIRLFFSFMIKPKG